jgi:hypothetical protein
VREDRHGGRLVGDGILGADPDPGRSRRRGSCGFGRLGRGSIVAL